MANFQIFKAINSQYYFRLRATGNNEIILNSEGYTTKESCKTGIQSVKTNAPYESKYDRRLSSNSKPYFVLKGGNGEIIGVSEMYENTYSRDRGIELVKTQAPTAVIDDIS